MKAAYSSWANMIARCYNPKARGFERYGGAGITVCDRWRGGSGFANFFADMGARPAGHSIERNDGTKNYTPENCRWATTPEQNRNKRNNRRFVYKGQSYVLADLARLSGLGVLTLRFRLLTSKEPWTVERAVETPPLPRELMNDRATAITHKGVAYPSISALARAVGVSGHNLHNRIRNGWTLEDAIRIPVGAVRKYA